MKITEGMTIRVKHWPINSYRKMYPWVPKLAGRVGIVSRVQDVLNDESIYHVNFGEPLQVGIIPEDESAFGYQATTFREVTEWAFLRDEIEVIIKK